MDSWPSAWERANENVEIVDIAGQNRLRKFDCKGHEVCVHNVGGTRPSENCANGTSVGKGVDSDGRQESRQSCLATAIAPHLSDNRVCGV
jgi:hypothetical protein